MEMKKKCHISLLSASGSDVLLFLEKLIYILIYFLCKYIAKNFDGVLIQSVAHIVRFFTGLMRKKILFVVIFIVYIDLLID